jgi:N6-adenosine-specific RNA methylase IME4
MNEFDAHDYMMEPLTSMNWEPSCARKRTMADSMVAYLGGQFPCIVADPPWTYSVFSDKGKDRSAEAHYDCMTLADIAALPVRDLAARNAHLFMWITGPCLVRGQHIDIMRAWGFEPSSDAFVWLKVKRAVPGIPMLVTPDAFAKGMGHTTRKNAEYVVLGRRGSPKRNTKAMHQLIIAPRREHSRKPDEFFVNVEAYCDGPRLELFSRESRPGWTTWGDEVEKFDAA